MAHYRGSVACQFPLSVKDVSAGKKFYDLRLGTRPAFEMTEPQGKAGTLKLTTGEG